MTIIQINDNLPGLFGLLETFPLHGRMLSDFAQGLMADTGALTRRERELIATLVSVHNASEFCAKSQAAVLCALGDNAYNTEDVFFSLGLASVVIADPTINGSRLVDLKTNTFSITERDLDLLYVAYCVSLNREVERRDDSMLLSEVEIHEAALVASAFSMLNRYVNGLNPTVPEDEVLQRAADRIVKVGYAKTNTSRIAHEAVR
jgi:AhpD family alkylhydroperoxidase